MVAFLGAGGNCWPAIGGCPGGGGNPGCPGGGAIPGGCGGGCPDCGGPGGGGYLTCPAGEGGQVGGPGWGEGWL